MSEIDEALKRLNEAILSGLNETSDRHQVTRKKLENLQRTVNEAAEILHELQTVTQLLDDIRNLSTIEERTFRKVAARMDEQIEAAWDLLDGGGNDV